MSHNQEEVESLEDHLSEDEDKIHYVPRNPHFFRDALIELRFLALGMLLVTLLTTLLFAFTLLAVSSNQWIYPFAYFLGAMFSLLNIYIMGYSLAFLFSGQSIYGMLGLFSALIFILGAVSLFAVFMSNLATATFLLGIILPIILGAFLSILLKRKYLAEK